MSEEAADELSKTTWRDDQWLTFYPLNVFTAVDYFALSPFYDRSCNNELAKTMGSDVKLATLPPGVEYELQDAQEPHLFVIRKQQRWGPKSTSPLHFYYILDGNVYQAPSLHATLSSRLSRCLYNVRAGFKLMQNDLDPLLKGSAVDSEAQEALVTAPPARQLGNAEKEQMRKADRIIMSVLQKFPMPSVSGAAPGPAYLAEGAAAAPPSEGEAVKAEQDADSVPSHP